MSIKSRQIIQLNINIKRFIIFYKQEIKKKGFLHTIRDINSFFNLPKKPTIKLNPLRSFHWKKKKQPSRNNI
jgi:hypothetical protein